MTVRTKTGLAALVGTLGPLALAAGVDPDPPAAAQHRPGAPARAGRGRRGGIRPTLRCGDHLDLGCAVVRVLRHEAVRTPGHRAPARPRDHPGAGGGVLRRRRDDGADRAPTGAPDRRIRRDGEPARGGGAPRHGRGAGHGRSSRWPARSPDCSGSTAAPSRPRTPTPPAPRCAATAPRSRPGRPIESGPLRAAELAVWGQGERLGYYVLEFAPGPPPERDRLLVAVTLADQVGAAFMAQAPPTLPPEPAPPPSGLRVVR